MVTRGLELGELHACAAHPDQLGERGESCPLCGQMMRTGTKKAPAGAAGPSSASGRFQAVPDRVAARLHAAPVNGADTAQAPAVEHETAGQEAGKPKGGGGGLVLRRGRRQMRPARVEWVTSSHTLPILLRSLRAEAGELVRVFMLGERPGGGSGDAEGFHRWAAELPAGWQAGDHYLHDLMAPVLRYQGPEAQRVEVLRAATWFGEQDQADPYTVERCEAAFDLLGLGLGEDHGAQLLRTPGATGRHLLQRLVPEGVEWPVLDHDVQQLIRSTSGQGRFEVMEGGAELGELVKVDARFAYAAVGRELGAGPALHRVYSKARALAEVWPDDARRYWPARYLVEGSVPRGWAHVGLLPVKAGDGSWRYPSKPGSRFRTWVDGAELHVAVKAGWAPKVREVLAFTPTPGSGPLGVWMDHLRALRDRMPPSPVGRLAADGVRSILLHSVGALHGSPHRVTKSLPADQAARIPVAELTGAPIDADGRIYWTAASEQAWPEMAHPEWSARIWAKTRARMAAKMLTLPRADIVAVQLDAIYLAADPGWVDDGKVGTLRRQWAIPGPLPRPSSLAELYRLVPS